MIAKTAARTFAARALPPVLAALLTGLVHLLAMRRSNLWPVGEISRGMGDYGPQYLPFHQAFAELLHGNPLISLQFNWFSGAGVGFLPDLATYLASPSALLVGAVPAQDVDVALAIIILLKLMLAGAAMTFLLTCLAPRSGWWPAVVLGTCYASSAWVFELGVFTPMWLDGLIGFPLLCLAARWSVARHRPWLSVALVAITWWSNFYSAYMASLGAGIFLLLWLAATASSWRAGLASVLRFLVTGILGVLLSAVLLVPTVMAVARGVDYVPPPLPPVTQQIVWSRVLPFTEGVSSTPLIYVGTVPFLLAISLLLPHGLRLRESWPWGLGVVALVASMQNDVVVTVWNAFDTPNGNPFRYSFVVCGFVVIAALFALQRGSLAQGRTTLTAPSPPSALVGLAVLHWIARDLEHVVAKDLHHNPSLVEQWAFPLGIALVLVSLLHRWRRVMAAAAGALALACLAEVVVCAGYIDEHARLVLGAIPLQDELSTSRTHRAANATQRADWPAGRVGGAPVHRRYYWTTLNEPMAHAYPSLPYYSSTIDADVSDMLIGLGQPFRAGGRMMMDRSDPGLDALLSVAARAKDPAFARVDSQEVLPMVRLAPAPRSTAADSLPRAPLPVVLERRNALLAEPIYFSATDVSFSTSGEDDIHPVLAGSSVQISARCAPGQTLHLASDSIDAMASWTSADGRGRRVSLFDRRVTPLTGIESGTFTLDPINRDTLLSSNSLACLDHDALQRQVAATARPAITVDGSRLAASFPEPVTGDVVVATAAQRGWSCQLDGQDAAITSRSGLLTVPAEQNRELSCRYRTPGLVPGAVLSLLALGGSLWWAGWQRGLAGGRRPRLSRAGLGRLRRR